MTSANRRVRDDQNLLPLQPDLARSEGRSVFISLNDLLYAALNRSLCGFSGLIFDPLNQEPSRLVSCGDMVRTWQPKGNLWQMIDSEHWYMLIPDHHVLMKDCIARGRNLGELDPLLCWSKDCTSPPGPASWSLAGSKATPSRKCYVFTSLTAGPSITGSSWIFLVGPSPDMKRSSSVWYLVTSSWAYVAPCLTKLQAFSDGPKKLLFLSVPSRSECLHRFHGTPGSQVSSALQTQMFQHTRTLILVNMDLL